MKNSLKHCLILTVLMMALFMPSLSAVYAKTDLNQNIVTTTKQPISKKDIAFRFIMAMVGVATSSMVIYVGLTIYNKLFKNSSDAVIGLNSLRTPQNFKESLNIFIEKTDWD